MSAAATEAARRLWARGVGDGAASDDVATVAGAAARVCAQIRTGLERWVGADGYRALLQRAIERARGEHPQLSELACTGDAEAMLAAVRAHGGAEVVAGLVTTVAALIDLLGRIVGEDMAVQLVAQTGTTGHRTKRPGSEMEGRHDG